MSQNSGAFHNAALDYYNNVAPLGTNPGTVVSERDFSTALNTLADFVKSIGDFTPADVDNEAKLYLAFLHSNNFFYTDPNGMFLDERRFTDYNLLLDIAFQAGAISTDLYQALQKVFVMIANAEDSDTILAYVDGLDASKFPSTDAGYLETFVSVYDSSYAYWNSRNAQARLNQNDGVIVMDAVGALHGLLLGPVVSIIEGAVCSIAKNHGWWSWL